MDWGEILVGLLDIPVVHYDEFMQAAGDIQY